MSAFASCPDCGNLLALAMADCPNPGHGVSNAELLTLLDIIAVRFESPRPIGGPDDAMLVAEIHAALKRARGQS